MVQLYSMDKLASLRVEPCESEAGYFVVVDQADEECRNIGFGNSENDVIKKLLEYGREHEYFPEILVYIRKGERVIQRPKEIVTDYQRLSKEERFEIVSEFIENTHKIPRLEAELNNKIKELREEYKKKRQAIIKTMKDQEDEIKLGARSIKVDASWEKDMVNNLKWLITHEEHECLSVDELTVAERSLDLFYDKDAQKDLEDSGEDSSDDTTAETDSETSDSEDEETQETSEE